MSADCVLAIDPGPTQSAWVLYVPVFGGAWEVRGFKIQRNDDVLANLRLGRRGFSPYYELGQIVIEKIESFGMAVGAEVFETVFWSGKFAEAAHPLPVDRIGRLKVKTTLCHDSRAKDSNIRAALIDRFTTPEQAAVGLKRTPGPLFGIAGDVWSALAVAVTWSELQP